MNRRKARRVAGNLAVVALVGACLLLGFLLWVRPSFTPAMALERAQRWYGSFFTGEVYELSDEAGGAVWLGRMGEDYGLVAAEKEGLLYRGTAVNTVRDLEGQPVAFAEGPGQIGLTENQGWFFGHVSDPDIVRVEVIWRAGHAQDNSETQSIVITEFQEGMFHFFLGFQSYIYDSPVFYDLTVGMDYILSAYDEDGELVCRYDDWDWERAPGPLEEGVHPVEPDWADGLDTTVKGSWTTVFYLRP